MSFKFKTKEIEACYKRYSEKYRPMMRITFSGKEEYTNEDRKKVVDEFITKLKSIGGYIPCCYSYGYGLQGLGTFKNCIIIGQTPSGKFKFLKLSDDIFARGVHSSVDYTFIKKEFRDEVNMASNDYDKELKRIRAVYYGIISKSKITLENISEMI